MKERENMEHKNTEYREKKDFPQDRRIIGRFQCRRRASIGIMALPVIPLSMGFR